VFGCGIQNLSGKNSDYTFLICSWVQKVIRTQTTVRGAEVQARRKVDFHLNCSKIVRNKVQ